MRNGVSVGQAVICRPSGREVECDHIAAVLAWLQQLEDRTKHDGSISEASDPSEAAGLLDHRGNRLSTAVHGRRWGGLFPVVHAVVHVSSTRALTSIEAHRTRPLDPRFRAGIRRFSPAPRLEAARVAASHEPLREEIALPEMECTAHSKPRFFAASATAYPSGVHRWTVSVSCSGSTSCACSSTSTLSGSTIRRGHPALRRASGERTRRVREESSGRRSTSGRPRTES